MKKKKKKKIYTGVNPDWGWWHRGTIVGWVECPLHFTPDLFLIKQAGEFWEFW